jgi:type II secretory pathway pseudopilin PulG
LMSSLLVDVSPVDPVVYSAVAGGLLVVALLAIIAYLAMPEFGGDCDISDLKLSNLTTNLQLVRAQLECYKTEHNHRYPTDIATGLTEKTNVDGTINESGAYGPYLQKFPDNPFVDDPAQAVKTSGRPGEGWRYDSVTGVFAANTPGHEDLAVPGGEYGAR